jgi:DNA-binding GntR family transcriptional regulator
LLRILDSVLGPVFVLAERDKSHRERDVAHDLQDHRTLIDLVYAWQAQQASNEIERHLTRFLENSLQTFRLSAASTGSAE